ncbi:hypothetical protein DCS_02670 [Drechmeria coniospora]|uniref:Uncharacterized protein n=1 Tax=Drechmeria coniospora TaxID=98403 RepID=A0A151GWQ3_DRECN|nr:hypothetical protein DCS_02670 [Drechmeria coniospora]KYK61528.1 hypothetical protein DCS_02670 [Drechmeria coniospora]
MRLLTSAATTNARYGYNPSPPAPERCGEDGCYQIQKYPHWEDAMTLKLKILGFERYMNGFVRPSLFDPEAKQRFDDEESIALFLIWNSHSGDFQKSLVRNGLSREDTPVQTMLAIESLLIPSDTAAAVKDALAEMRIRSFGSIERMARNLAQLCLRSEKTRQPYGRVGLLGYAFH